MGGPGAAANGTAEAADRRLQLVADVGDEVAADRVDPTALGIPAAPPESLRGGAPAVNADVFRRVLDGERGPVRDAVLLNAAAALAAFDERAQRLHDALAAGLERAAAAVDDGRAAALLERWVTVSRAVRDAG